MNDSQQKIISAEGQVFYDMDSNQNPCFDCGACCKYFRVSFYAGELDSLPGGSVPEALTIPITPFRVAMRGTEKGHGRCMALGKDNRCTIYTQRPSVCREFPAFLEDGTVNPECLRLQKFYALTSDGNPF